MMTPLPNILTCHGYNDGYVRDVLDPMNRKFRSAGYNVQEADYGDFNFIDVLQHNSTVARMLAGMVNVDTVAIGHSNGAAILYEALNRTPDIHTLILFNPALDSNLEFPGTLGDIIIYYNSADYVVEAADKIPLHIWGNMGRVGYTGRPDSRIRNYDTKALFNVSGHSEALTRATNLAYIHMQTLGVI